MNFLARGSGGSIPTSFAVSGSSVRSRAPLRLGLAGGGTDVSPYMDLYGGAVLNVTIDRYIYCTIELTGGDEVVLESHDLGMRAVYPSARLPLPFDGRLDLLKAVYNRIARDYLEGQGVAMRISTFSEAPAGSGLGSSSTLVVAVLQALCELFSLPLGEYDIAHLAFEIERQDLGLHGGRQDQYAATFGGFNFMEFQSKDRVVVNPLRIKPEIATELEMQLLLCFTGINRESAGIIEKQSRNVREGDARSIEAMHQIKVSAVAMKEALLRGELWRLTDTLRETWQHKRDMAEGITSNPIEEAMTTALAAGANAGKISGAGGGGFLWFLVPIARRRQVVEALAARQFRTETCRFTTGGASSWRI